MTEENKMPHFHLFASGSNHDYQGAGKDSHDRPANADTAYLLSDLADETHVEIIVPAVYVREITTFPPVGASTSSGGADTFIWDTAQPAQPESYLPGLTKYPDVKLSRGVHESGTPDGAYTASDVDASSAATVGAARTITIGAIQTETIGVDDALF